MPFGYVPPFPPPPTDRTVGRLDLGMIKIPSSWHFEDEDHSERFQKAIAVQEMNEVDYFSKRYDLAGYVSINQMISISLSDWMGGSNDPFIRRFGLPDIIKQSLAHEVSEVARQIERKRKEQQDELTQNQQDFRSNLQFGSANSSMGKVFG